jgi:hypothetical protein
MAGADGRTTADAPAGTPLGGVDGHGITKGSGEGTLAAAGAATATGRAAAGAGIVDRGAGIEGLARGAVSGTRNARREDGVIGGAGVSFGAFAAAEAGCGWYRYVFARGRDAGLQVEQLLPLEQAASESDAAAAAAMAIRMCGTAPSARKRPSHHGREEFARPGPTTRRPGPAIRPSPPDGSVPSDGE